MANDDRSARTCSRTFHHGRKVQEKALVRVSDCCLCYGPLNYISRAFHSYKDDNSQASVLLVKF